MIEPDWDTAWRKENRYAVAHDHRAGVIDFKALATVQLNREYLKR